MRQLVWRRVWQPRSRRATVELEKCTYSDPVATAAMRMKPCLAQAAMQKEHSTENCHGELEARIAMVTPARMMAIAIPSHPLPIGLRLARPMYSLNPCAKEPCIYKAKPARNIMIRVRKQNINNKQFFVANTFAALPSDHATTAIARATGAVATDRNKIQL